MKTSNELHDAWMDTMRQADAARDMGTVVLRALAGRLDELIAREAAAEQIVQWDERVMAADDRWRRACEREERERDAPHDLAMDVG